MDEPTYTISLADLQVIEVLAAPLVVCAEAIEKYTSGLHDEALLAAVLDLTDEVNGFTNLLTVIRRLREAGK